MYKQNLCRAVKGEN